MLVSSFPTGVLHATSSVFTSPYIPCTQPVQPDLPVLGAYRGMYRWQIST